MALLLDSSGAPLPSSQRQDHSLAYMQEAMDVSQLWSELRLNFSPALGMDLSEDPGRGFCEEVAKVVRFAWIKSPLMRRAAELMASYVWGQGVDISSEVEEANEVLKEFVDSRAHREALFGHTSRRSKDMELSQDGNLFWLLFTSPSTGKVRLRTAAWASIEEPPICNPDDDSEVWFYGRREKRQELDGTTRTKMVYHPEAFFSLQPGVRRKNGETLRGRPIRWDVPIYHMKVGGRTDWKWGLSPYYPAIDWSKAYGETLQAFSSFIQALTVFAWKYKGAATAQEAQNTKTNFTSTIGMGSPGYERNPAPTRGSLAVAPEGRDLEPMKIASAVPDSDKARRLKLMAINGMGLWSETFFADGQNANLASAKVMDRPSELGVKDRQATWDETYTDICTYVLIWAIKAPSGALRQVALIDPADEEGAKILWHPKKVNGEEEEVDGTVRVEFPDVLEKDTQKSVESIIEAFTLGGKKLAFPAGARIMLHKMLVELGFSNPRELLDQILPEDALPEPSLAQQEEPKPPRTPQSPDETEEEEQAEESGGSRQYFNALHKRILEALELMKEEQDFRIAENREQIELLALELGLESEE